jgi:hypothetical protein
MHGMHMAISKVEKLGPGFVLLAEVCPSSNVCIKSIIIRILNQQPIL